MSDKKLEELIEKYMTCKSKEIVLPFQLPPDISKSTKARQAIVDYVEQEKREAYDKGYEKAVALWKEGME